MECWCTAFVNDQCFISNSLMNASLHVWSQITNPHHYFVSFRNNTLSYDYPNCNSLAFILYSYQVVEKKKIRVQYICPVICWEWNWSSFALSPHSILLSDDRGLQCVANALFCMCHASWTLHTYGLMGLPLSLSLKEFIAQGRTTTTLSSDVGAT